MNKLAKTHDRVFYLIWYLIVAFLLISILFPLICSFSTPTFSDFQKVFTQQRYLKTILNTLIECVCSTSFSVFFGYIYAYAIVKANIPFKRFFSLIPILHLVTPPFVGGLSFILLFGRQGFFTHTILNLDISLYGFWGLLISQVLCFFPVAYLICLQTLAGINQNYEQAALGMGASKLKIFFTVTLPLSKQGLFSSFLFITVSVLSDFGNPLIVAGRFKVLAVEIYTQLTGWLNSGISVVLGLILVVPSVILFILQLRLSKKHFLKLATIGAKTSFSTSIKSSKITKCVLLIFCAFLSFLVLSQFFSIIIGSFQQLWGINTNFTLKHIKAVFEYSKQLLNSLVFAFIASLLATLIASFSSFCINRNNSKFSNFYDILIQIPSCIPGSLLGLSILIAANKIHFTSSKILIIIAMTISFLPFSYRIISSSFSQIKPNLDEAAKSLGANKLNLLCSILMPISKTGINSAFTYNFVRAVGTVSSVIFLISFDSPLSSVTILNLAEQGDWGKACAFALVLTCLTFIILKVESLIYEFIRKKWKQKHI